MKNKKHTSRELSDHIEGQAIIKDDAGAIDNEHNGVEWEATKGEVHSTTNLEDDLGIGKKVVLRIFNFGANPEMFRLRTPSKQELFDSCSGVLEAELLKDGLWPIKEVVPRLKIWENKKGFTIIVTAEAKFGESITDRSLTLTDIAHGNSKPNTN